MSDGSAPLMNPIRGPRRCEKSGDQSDPVQGATIDSSKTEPATRCGRATWSVRVKLAGCSGRFPQLGDHGSVTGRSVPRPTKRRLVLAECGPVAQRQRVQPLAVGTLPSRLGILGRPQSATRSNFSLPKIARRLNVGSIERPVVAPNLMTPSRGARHLPGIRTHLSGGSNAGVSSTSRCWESDVRRHGLLADLTA